MSAPTTSGGRTLVLCFDGTGNDFSKENTNVVKLFSLLDKNQTDKQLVYYQPGIATYTSPTVWTGFRKIAETLDFCIAWYLDAHILGGYSFLQQSYQYGDKICIFGFSRGAYTARCLAGMLTKIGLIPSNMPEQLPLAYKLYTSEGKDNDDLAAAFKRSFSRNVAIEFLGCWDTVSSVGVLLSRTLPFSSSSTLIRRFRQALSCDENRARWGLMRWTQPTAEEKDEQEEGAEETDVKEVWFAGCHNDLGGGHTLNSARNKLSNLPFRWMISEILLADIGIIFIPRGLKDEGIFPSTSFAQPTNEDGNPFDSPLDPPSLPSRERDRLDAISPMDDELKSHLKWWLLEFAPVITQYQDANGKWRKTWRINFFRPRHVEGDVVFHESIKLREEDSSLGYTPRVKYTGKRTWVGTPGI